MRTRHTSFFTAAVWKLDGSERYLVLKTVRKLELSNEWLGKRLRGELHEARSLRTGHNHRLRLVYLEKTGVGILLTVGARKDLVVYSEAANVLRELGL
jgi:mRNA-degrading endonuclease RelE of RelBE toxin-antitoxin system